MSAPGSMPLDTRDTEAHDACEDETARFFAFEWDRRTDAFWHSPDSARILGPAAGPMHDTGEARLARLHPGDRARLLDRIRALSPAAPTYQATYHLPRPDGGTVRVAERGYATFDASGELSRLAGIVTELRPQPERRGAAPGAEPVQPALPASEAQLRFALTAAEAGIWEWDPGTGDMVWSSENYALYGRDPADGPPTYAQWLSCLHPDDREGVIAGLWDAVEGRTPELRAEFRVIHPEQGLRWLFARARVERGSNRVVHRLSGIHLDITERKTAEEALRESEERYRLVAEYTYDWEYWIGPDRRLRYVSPSCERMTGWSTADFLDDPGLLEAIVHPDDAALVQGHLRDELMDEARRELQFRIRTRTGQTRWIEHACQPVYGPDGCFVGRRASNRDITDRKQVEEALRRREREFETLAENAPDVIARFDRSLRHLYVNSAVTAATGLPPEAFIGKTNAELGMPAHLCELWSTLLREVLRTGEPCAAEFDFPGPQGERHYGLRAVPERGPDGAVETVLSIARDETRRKQSEARLRIIAENVPVALFETDAAGVVTYLSPAWERLTGRPPSAAVGQPWTALLHGERDAVAARWRQVMEPGRALSERCRVLAQDGTALWVQVEAQPVRNAAGAVSGWFGSISDTTAAARTEQRLARERELLQRLVDGIPVMVVMYDPSIATVQVNPEFERLVGWSTEDLKRLDIMEVCYPDPAYREQVRQFMASLESGWREFRITARDGSIVESAWANIRLPDDTQVGIGIDLRERKRAEARIRQLATVVEATSDFIGIAGLDRRALYLNHAGQALVGLEGEAAVRATRVEDYLFAEDLPFVYETVLPTVMATGRWAGDFRLRHFQTGEAIAVRWDVFRIDDPQTGEPRQLATVTRDIRQQKAAEAELRERETQFRRMFEIAAVGMAQVDPRNGRFLRVNAKYCQLTGYSAEELADMTFPELTHPDDRAADFARFQRVARGEMPEYLTEKRYVRKDGTVIWVLVNAVMIRDAQGEAVRTVAAVIDITARKQAEDALHEADTRKNEFLAMLGHELRNPLAPIRNAAEVMRLLDPEEPRLRWAQEVIERQVGRLTRLVDDLLDLSRIVRGRIALKREPVTLGRLVEQAVDEVRGAMERHRHRFALTLPEEPVWLDADPVRLVQVLVNLLDNAAKYTPDGGDITLAAEVSEAQVMIRVRDSGTGIAPALLPHVFDLFAQGEQSLDRSQGGLGIGLTIVRRLVELHGGEVAAASAGPNCGSEFTVRLPRHRGPQDGAGPMARHAPDGPGRRILVVDDDAAVADTTALWLQLQGYEVRVARSGESALAIARELGPDVVLLDIGLPDMDGYQVAARLRAEPYGREMLLVAVTGYGHEEARKAALAAGFDHHLTKPVDPQVLLALLTQTP